MAEADPRPSETARRYFCHQCNKDVAPKLPDIVCSVCNSGFIEEVSEESYHLPTQEQGEERSSSSHLYREDSDSSDPDRDRDESLGTAVAAARPYPNSRITYHHLAMAPSLRMPGAARRANLRGGGPHLDFLSHLLSTFSDAGGLGGIQILHGNPGDYAWGANGLDAIITQLLNNMDASGPPAADKSTIAALPSVRVSQEQADAKVQCSVCFDEFAVGDEAISLPCKHLYHRDCIIKWLEMHGTCPVCRKDLNGADTSTQEYGELTETLTTLEEQAAGHGGAGTGGPSSARTTSSSGTARGAVDTQQQQPPGASPDENRDIGPSS